MVIHIVKNVFGCHCFLSLF